MPVLKNLEINLAGRYDKYSDFGDTFNPKIGIRYQPTPQLVLRGSANTGFRAPTLYEIHQPASLTFTSDSYDDPLLCPGGVAVPGASAGVVCGQQVLLRQAGPASLGLPADTLKPEKSKSFNLGLVFEPIKNTSLGHRLLVDRGQEPDQPAAGAGDLRRPGQVQQPVRALQPARRLPARASIATTSTPA